MNVELRTSKVGIQELLKRYVDRRLQFALGRFGERVSNVSVRLYGSGRGSEGRCRVTADIYPVGTIAADVRDPDLFSAMDRATGRLSRRVARALGRFRDARKTNEIIRLAA